MKTIKRGDVVRRVTDEEAAFLTKKEWDYCPKAEHKKTHNPQPVSTEL